jgi:hypothetical protein
MARVNPELSRSVHEYAKRLAKKDGVTVKQLIASALAENLAALDAETHIKNRLKRANRKAYDEILTSAPARAPLKGDELPR